MGTSIAFPPELQCCPKPFVVLTGLDITFNAVHKSIWDAFSNNRRQDRLQVKFACLPGDHAFPRCKTKRSSYDWYIPKGLLKTKWMNKHLNEVPALVVVFFELDWDELAWRERHLACASRVQVVRSSLQGRNTKVAVVLIQKSTPLPPGEDMVAAERAAALCSACDLSSKSLFVLPHSDHLLGYIVRLESAFVELAHTYYHSELRRVKAHKEFLNKTTHQLLFPRHQFKIAFFSEFMQDFSTALRHYQQSYNHIHELRTNATNNLEVKVVGGFVNYKICRIFFLQLNAPLDALNQFQRHIEQFKLQFGIPDLMFEHCAWLSQQYLLFGDLFNIAIDQGLAAIQTQHPGFYYKQASHFATLRKKFSWSVQASVGNLSYPSPDPLETECLEFFGQRPWRQGHQRIDPPDVELESNGILALKIQELQVDHSWNIIPLISSAVSQFKKFHCPRLKRHLTIKMGIEYFHAEDYSKAIALLCRSVPQYRDCKWCSILTQLVSLVFECSYMLGDVQNYITSALELMFDLSELPPDKKTKIQRSMCDVLCGKMPKFILLSSKIVSKSNDSPPSVWRTWTEKSSSSILHVEMSDLLPCVECKVKFSLPEVSIDSCVQVEVYTRITCLEPMEFTELSVYFSNSSYNSNCVVTDTQCHGALYYEPNEIKRHMFEFPVEYEDLHKFIQVKSVKLKLGFKAGGCILHLNWLKVTDTYNNSKSETICNPNQSMLNWKNIVERKSLQVIERRSRLHVNVINEPPALTNEAFPIKFLITSEENLSENINVLVTLKPDDHVEDFFQSSYISMSDNPLIRPCRTVEMEFKSLKQNEKFEMVVYFRSAGAGTATLNVQSNYTVSNLPVQSTGAADKELNHINCPSKSSFNVCFDVIDPFSFTAHLTSMNMQSVSSVYFGQPFMILASLTAHSPWPIEILSKCHALPNNSVFKVISHLQQDELCVFSNEGESVVKCLVLNAPLGDGKQTKVEMAELGIYTVKWKRQTSNNPPTETMLKMPRVPVRLFPVTISANFPAHGTLRQLMKVGFDIQNTSKEFKIVEISFESVESFMFSGPKQTKLFLSPLDSHSIECILIPLALGYQALPKIQIRGVHMHEKGTSDVLQRDDLNAFMLHSSIPSEIYIKPKLS